MPEALIVTLADLAAALDSSHPARPLETRILLGRSVDAARARGDVVLEEAIHCEGVVIELFARANDLRVAIADRAALFSGKDIDYLGARAHSTKSTILRARYQHAIAWTTKRFDTGQESALTYLNAIVEAAAGPDPIERERTLRHLAPLALSVAKKYRKGGKMARALIDVLERSAPILSLEIVRLLVPEPLERNERERLREPLFRIVAALGGTSLLDRMIEAARIGMRLDAKLGNVDLSPWNAALLEGLRKTIAGGEHGLLREQAAQQAAFILQQMGLDEERAEVIATQRELARANQPEWSHSETIDKDGSFAESIRTNIDKRISELGEVGILAYLGLSTEIMPQMQHARDSLVKQHEAGIGVFRQLVQTTVRSRDNRVIGHASPGAENENRALVEQFGYGCIFAWYAMDVAAQHMIVNGTIRSEHFDELLDQTWIGDEESGRQNDLPSLLSVPLEAYVDVITGVGKPASLILVIDSLTMRLEAVLRKFARLHRVGDTREIRDQQGRLVTEVLGITQVLGQRRVSAALGEDLVALVRQTLIGEDEGLRNRVGHAITGLADYGIFTAHSLVFLLLRLAMVGIGTAEDDGEEEPGISADAAPL